MNRVVVAILLAIVLAAPAVAQDRIARKEIVVGLAAEPRTMLAVTIVDWTTNTQLEHMYDRLLDRDAKTLKPKPMLATGWKIVNDHTVRFVTDKPWPALIDRISLTDFLVLPAKALKELGPEKLAQQPIGTGPFRFVEWKRDERLVMERNPDYWAGAAELSRVTFRFIPEFSARLAAMLSGEIDIMKDVPPHVVDAVDKSGRAKVRSAVSSRINYLALVTLKPGPMQDLRVRRAMSHAVDVDELIAKVLQGRASKICGPLSPANVDYATVECYKYDPARAQALFKEAGVDPAKLQLTLDSPSGRYPLDKDVSQAIAAQLQRLGIKVTVVVNEWGTHLDKVKNRTTGDLTLVQISVETE